MEIKISKLNEMLQFQEGTVASRTILNKDTGTVTFFAFDKEEGLSEHKTPYDAMVLVTEGIAEITISDVTYEVTSGETIIMPANEPHKVRAIEQFKMLLIMIKS